MRAYLEVFNVTVSFGSYIAIKGINLLVNKGEFVSIIGHSGCGKSTLLNVVGGIIRPTEGSVSVEGKEIVEPGPDRAIVFQNYSLLPWLSVYENVYTAVKEVYKKESSENIKKRVEHYLRMVGLWEHSQKKPAQISGGMKQRTAIARALAVDPKILLLDEPLGALDALTKSTLQDELLSIWERDKKTVLMVTHDIDEAIYLSDRIVIMGNGPAANIYEVVNVDIERPRNRERLLRSREYAELKQYLVHTLHEKLKKKEVA